MNITRTTIDYDDELVQVVLDDNGEPIGVRFEAAVADAVASFVDQEIAGSIWRNPTYDAWYVQAWVVSKPSPLKLSEGDWIVDLGDEHPSVCADEFGRELAAVA